MWDKTDGDIFVVIGIITKMLRYAVYAVVFIISSEGKQDCNGILWNGYLVLQILPLLPSCIHNYASPVLLEAYRDRQLTTNFELKIFVCRHVSIWGFQNRVCLSVSLSVCPSVCLSVCPSVLTPRKEITIASLISVLHW